MGSLYAFLLTLLAFDLLMSLEPHFYSTLFGAWYFMGSFYTGISAVILLMVCGVRFMGMEPFIRPLHFLAVGQLLLGFCLVTGDFFFTQILIIWYSNLPGGDEICADQDEGAALVLLRLGGALFCYVIPFGVLISRKIKMKPVAHGLFCRC